MNRLEKRGDLYPRGVLQTCLDVHMRHVGSSDSDPMSQEKDIKLLQTVIDTWDNSNCSFDEGVFQLVLVTLVEVGVLNTMNG